MSKDFFNSAKYLKYVTSLKPLQMFILCEEKLKVSISPVTSKMFYFAYARPAFYKVDDVKIIEKSRYLWRTDNLSRLLIVTDTTN